ncbi:MAG: ABC transporter substrate-binding protein [Chlamydiae bacterium]|nr:ABC transporter substrate-binding protein [Chlamydiota bacterium]
MNKIFFTCIFSAVLSFSCTKPQDNTKKIRIGATPIPQGQILEFIKPELQKQGYTLQIMIMEDYNLMNRALADGDIDANFFQHVPFLEKQIKQFGYNICSLAKVHIEPMGIYSQKIKSLASLPEGSIVAIPSDPSNEARALLLLEKNGLINLPKTGNTSLTTRDIAANPKKLKFQELDAAILSRSLPDVTIAVIPTNFALQAGLSPSQGSLALEGKDSPYVNIIAVRCEDLEESKLIALKSVMNSKQVYDFILGTYKGEVIPSFSAKE